jgi:hypothetical protein
MKKNHHKTLTLMKETVRRLNDGELRRVVGDGTLPTRLSICRCDPTYIACPSLRICL